MFNILIEYLDKHKIAFTIILLCLFVGVLYMYINKSRCGTQENMESVQISSFDQQFTENNQIINLQTSIPILLTDASGNKTQINKQHYLSIIKRTDCGNINLIECISNEAVLIDSDKLNDMFNQYKISKQTILNKCVTEKYNRSCSSGKSNNVAQCSNDFKIYCKPEQNMRFVSDFVLNKTSSQRYTLEGKSMDILDASENIILGNPIKLSRSLYSLIPNNSRHVCFDGGQGENIEFDFIHVNDNNIKLKFSYMDPQTKNQKQLYVGISDIQPNNTCNYNGILFPRIALYDDPNSPYILTFNISLSSHTA
jgi:hypothetical protein